MMNERADKNTDAGNYQTKSNHYEAPEKKTSKKLDLSLGDVVVLNPRAAWSPDAKVSAGLYGVVTSIKSDDSVSVEAENGSVYKLLNKNQFAKVKGMKEAESKKVKIVASGKEDTPTWHLMASDGSSLSDMFFDTKDQAKAYADKKGYIIEESVEEDEIRNKTKMHAKQSNKNALGNLGKNLAAESPATDAAQQRILGTKKDDKDYDEDYYYSEGDRVRLNPKVSESVQGDLGIVRKVTEKHLMVEIEGQGIVPVLEEDIDDIYDEGEVPEEMADEGNIDDEIVDNIISSIILQTGMDANEVYDLITPEDILDAFEDSGQDTDATVSFLVDQLMNPEDQI